MARRVFQKTKEVIERYGLDLRVFIWLHGLSLINASANIDLNGVNKMSWATTMSPIFIHDAFAVLGAITYTNNVYPKRPILRTLAFYHMKKFYWSIITLKILFDTLLCCELSGVTSNGAMVTASPLLLLVAILFGRHVWCATLQEEPVRH